MTDSCGCCEGIEIVEPERITNRPGLDTLLYRVGTHGSFLETMLARLSQVEVPSGDGDKPTRPLAGLATRSSSDPTVALLDGWAMVADILTFYQERIANEGYLRTATERRSILELARLVGYKLRPGVASTVYLAYTLDPNQVEEVDLPLYTRAQSVPGGPGETAQSFETVEKLQARAKWNTLQPRLSRPQTVDSILAGHAVYFKGITTNLQPGDPLLIDDGKGQFLLRVIQVKPDPVKNTTTVQAEKWISDSPASGFLEDAARTLELYKTRMLQVIKQALADVDSESQAAQTASAKLGTLSTRLENAQSMSIDKEVQDTLAELDALNQNLPSTATKVGPWLEKTYKLLSETRDTVLRTGTGTASFAASGGDGANGIVVPDKPKDQLLTVLQGLSVPPSIPPRNAAYLKGDLASAFKTKSDLGLQIVGAAKPDLISLLPVAVANVQATQPSPLQIYVLRVKAGVYGNTAPPRQITDERSRVIQTADWPINTERQAVLTWNFGNTTSISDPYTVQAQSWTSEGDMRSIPALTVDKNENKSANDGDFTLNASVSTDTPPTLVVTWGVTGFAQTVTLSPGTGKDSDSFFISSKSSDGLDFSSSKVGANNVRLFIKDRQFEMTWDVEGQTGTFTTQFPIPPQPRTLIALDAPYDTLTPGGRVVVVRDSEIQKNPLTFARILKARTYAHNSYNFPSKVTDLTLDTPWLTDQDFYLHDIADTVVLAGSESLDLAEEPIDDPICGADQWIELDDVYSGLEAGRWLIVSGPRADISDANAAQPVKGLTSAELVMLADVMHDVYRGQTEPPTNGGDGKEPVPGTHGSNGKEIIPGDNNHTFIRLSTPLAYCYERDQVTIYGNVIKATHGETVNEALGSGDGSQAFQTFQLQSGPLTFVSAPTTAGAASTLKVYVNNVQWDEAETFVGLAPTDHDYVTKTDDADKVSVITGNGETGARLPTGYGNVRATYRKGLGKAGNVAAGKISLLSSRPLGVKGVINPMPATGGADRESGPVARRNVPLGVLALDRLVSVQDYADFSRTFAGIGKAASTLVPFGDQEMVHVTIAGADDIPIDVTSDLYRNLLLALRTYGNPDTPLRVDLRDLLLIVLQADIAIDSHYLWDSVVQEIKSSLYATLSFQNSALGQNIWLSQVIKAMQQVEGVTYVDVQVFGGIAAQVTDSTGVRRPKTPDEITQDVQNMLAAQSSRPAQFLPVRLAGTDGGTLHPAELAVLSPDVPGTLVLNQVVQ